MEFNFLGNVHRAYTEAAAMFFTFYSLANETYEDLREWNDRVDQLFPVEGEDAGIDLYDIEHEYQSYALSLRGYAESVKLLEKVLWQFNAETVLENHMAHEVEFMCRTYQFY